MRRIALILLPLVVGLLACKRPETNDPKHIPIPILPNTSAGVASDPAAPTWIDNPPPFSAVGQEAPNSMGDISFQRSFAIAHARNDLARDMELRTKTMLQELGQASLAVSEKLKNPSGQVVKESTSRQFTDVTLGGTRAQSFYTDRKGNLWVLVVADPAAVRDTLRARVRKELVDLGLGQADLQDAVARMEATMDASQKAPR